MLISLIFIIIDNEIEWDSDKDNNNSYMVAINGMRCINSVLAVINVVLLILRAQAESKLFLLKSSLTVDIQKATFAGIMFRILEVGICLLIIPPYMETGRLL